MIDNRKVGKGISALRQRRNMTQQQLAATLNVSHQAVSKWENGAALPDVQTLMDLSRMFGVTMEQLLNGEVAGLDDDQPAPDPIHDIGKFFTGVVSGVFGNKDEDKDEDDGAEPVQEDVNRDAEMPIDLGRLLQMAPYMSKSTVEYMLLKQRDKLTPADVAKFAPYISRECLEQLVQRTESPINWDTLRRIAPFLRREVVDRLARAAEKGTQFVENVAENSGIDPNDVTKTLEDVSRTIGRAADKAFRKAQKLGEDVADGLSDAIGNIFDAPTKPESRADMLRRAAVERALNDGRYDWLAQHMDDFDDETKAEISRRACEAGMSDWVVEHMGGEADVNDVDAALLRGDWNALAGIVRDRDDATQQKIAMAAAEAGNWAWIADCVDMITLLDCAGAIGAEAYAHDVKPLAAQILEASPNDDARTTIADAAASADDIEFLRNVAEALPETYFGKLCVERAKTGQWAFTTAFVGCVDADSLLTLMELAIAEGNFEAVDLIVPHL